MSRFFIDHGVVHDGLTGQHVGMEAEPDHVERLLALLRDLERQIEEHRQAGALLIDAGRGDGNVGRNT